MKLEVEAPPKEGGVGRHLEKAMFYNARWQLAGSLAWRVEFFGTPIESEWPAQKVRW